MAETMNRKGLSDFSEEAIVFPQLKILSSFFFFSVFFEQMV